MESSIGVTEAREKLSDLVDQVQHRGNKFIINRHGKPAAAIVPVEIYENWKRQREELFDLIRQMQERADLEPEEAERIAAEAVAAVRKQTHPAR